MTSDVPQDVPILNLTDEDLDQRRADPRPEGTIEERREDTRKRIAYALLLILGLVCFAWAAVGVWGDAGDVAGAGDALDKIFAGVLGLTGTAVGFYFGSAGTGATTGTKRTEARR